MRTTLLCALLATTLVLPQAGRTTRQWTTIRDGDAQLTAEFPAPPIRETQPNGMVRWMVQLDSDNYAYIVGMIVIPPERMAVGIPKLLEDAVAGGVRNVNGAQVLQDTPITFQGFPGRELLIKAPGAQNFLRIAARAIIARDRMYILTAVSPFEGFDQKEIDRFLASLTMM
jgi:hypothetical protein